MTIPTTGSFTSETVRAEWGYGLPYNSENLRATLGWGAFNSDQIRGLSSYDPNADGISWPNAYDSNFGTAGAASSGTVTGINAAISVTVAISSPCTVRKRMYLSCGGTVIADTTTGSSWTFNVTNGQTISISFGCTQQYSPKQLNTLWQGTCTITNNTTGGSMGSFDFNILAEAEDPGF
uniref:Uncharacterized protein n=1 Tax=Caulobacter sp. (strain K31) TaxID=366602 RepID=B0T647_CAUSK